MKALEKSEALLKALTERVNRQLSHLPPKIQKRSFIAAGCVVASLCLFMVVSPFTTKDNDTQIVPRGESSTVVVPPIDPLLSTSDLMMLQDFKQVMDSLKIYDKKTFREILQGREGLLDTVEFLLRWNQ